MRSLNWQICLVEPKSGNPRRDGCADRATRDVEDRATTSWGVCSVTTTTVARRAEHGPCIQVSPNTKCSCDLRSKEDDALWMLTRLVEREWEVMRWTKDELSTEQLPGQLHCLRLYVTCPSSC